MEGMIFAAGLGTRLRPLTDERPKALVELKGKPLLAYAIENMRQAGIRRIVVNVHHFAGQIEDFLRHYSFPEGEILISDERDGLLDTGGGLRKASSLFTAGEDVLVHNVDIFSQINLKELMACHRQSKADATLVVSPFSGGRGLRFNAEGLLKGWENVSLCERKIVDEDFWRAEIYSFCGVQVIGPEFLHRIEREGAFSIIDEYLSQARLHPVRMYFYEGLVRDLGTPRSLGEVEKNFL